MSSIDLKNNIDNYYNKVKPVEIIKPEIALDNISKSIIFDLLDNGIDVEDIDNILLNALKMKVTYKFKSYVIHKTKAKCKICSTRKNLELHHIKPVSKYPELKYDFDNVIILCCSCHQAVETGASSNVKHKGTIKNVFNNLLQKSIANSK